MYVVWFTVHFQHREPHRLANLSEYFMHPLGVLLLKYLPSVLHHEDQVNIDC